MPTERAAEIPTEIVRTDDGLTIRWNDGRDTTFSARELRDACPCATCRERRGETASEPEEPSAEQTFQLPVLSAAQTAPVRVLHMKPVGHYAYGIEFSDGHSSGLFTFAMLRQLGLN